MQNWARLFDGLIWARRHHTLKLHTDRWRIDPQDALRTVTQSLRSDLDVADAFNGPGRRRLAHVMGSQREQIGVAIIPTDDLPNTFRARLFAQEVSSARQGEAVSGSLSTRPRVANTDLMSAHESASSSVHSSCSVSWYREGVMEFAYRGHVTSDDLNAVVAEAQRMTSERTPSLQLVDTLAVASVPPEIGEILNRLLESYREAGGTTVVMIASASLHQMLGRSMSFGAGVALKLFESREEALQFVAQYSAK